MEVKVKVISSEMIKPSSPTPSHLKTFKLSSLDQLFPQGVQTSVNLFYLPPSDNTSSNNNTTALLVDQLKISLSKTLARFYPLAARINEDNNISIDCNDEGALFTHVHLGCHMSEFLKPPINHNLLHEGCGGGGGDESGGGVQILIRLHEFTCGGICIGMRCLHKIIDGATMSAFLKSWAAFSANTNTTFNNSTTSSIDQEDELRAASKLFPPKETQRPTESSYPSSSKPPSLTNTKKIVWSRFVFDAKAISTLKSMNNENPVASRVILVSSFILNHVIAASSSSSSASAVKQFLIIGPVNIRPRIGPPFSQNSIGNLLWNSMTYVPSTKVTFNKVEMMMRLVALRREAITEINRDFLKRFQGEGGYDVTQKFNLERFRSIFGQGLEVETCVCTSWCRFGFNELDFGWGKPLWYCNDARVPVPAASFVNTFLLIDTPTGDGIEAQLMFDEALMTTLELDQDFLTLASINPSIVP